MFQFNLAICDNLNIIYGKERLLVVHGLCKYSKEKKAKSSSVVCSMNRSGEYTVRQKEGCFTILYHVMRLSYSYER
jgi:hypothetical protein